ncbi:DUF4199 domain-containing protein [Penaeicola halotolerans]|uniref:DUF4199 domain-containing protein n=1 Tax=Penaeicola halotolerans TaxID=2793196 RepID=UPI001CF8E244|nr:DUF4199 domain-containing protein [Penaeicola halotolerans]
MENQMTIGESAKKWGLIYGLIGFVVIVLSDLLGLTGSTSMSIVSSIINWAIAFTMYFLATKEYRDSNKFMSFGEGFKIVMLVGLLGGVLRSLVFYIYIKFIDTTYIQRIMEASQEMQRQMGLGDQPQEMPAGFEFFQSAEFIALSPIFSAIIGALILGLIAAAINKREDQTAF